MNPQNYLAISLLVWVLPSCSLVRSPEKTLGQVRDRFAEGSMLAAAEAKGRGLRERDLEGLALDPGRIGVGDLVVVRRVGEEGHVKLEPVFSIERTVESGGGLTDEEKRILIMRVRRIMCHRTAFSTEVEVSRLELGKVEDIEGAEWLREKRDGLGGGRKWMRFGLEGGMEELRGSVLEDVYQRVARGTYGGVLVSELRRYEEEMQRQLHLVEARLLSGEEVYAIGKVVMVEKVTGRAVDMGEDGQPAVKGVGAASAVAAFGKVMVPHVGESVPEVERAAGTAEFRRVPRYCWAVAGYRVSRAPEGGFKVDSEKPLRF